MGMAHQSLDGSKIIPIIQKGSGKGVPHYMGMNPLLDQGPLCHRLDEAINRLGSQPLFLIGTMLPQRLEEGMRRNLFPLPMTSMTAWFR